MRTYDQVTFGIWSVLGSLALIFGIFDFGFIGTGLRNKLASIKDHKEENIQFLSIFYLVFLICTLMIVCILFSFPYVPWGNILNVDQPIHAPIIFISIAIFLRAPFALNIVGFLGYEETHLKGMCDLLEFFLMGIATLLVVFFGGSFHLALYTYYAAFTLGSVFSFALLLKVRKWQLTFISFPKMKEVFLSIFHSSFFLYLYNLCAVLLITLLPILVSRATNIVAAGEFSLSFKLFTLLMGIHYTLLTPLWPAYTHASIEGDHIWIRKNFFRSIIFTLILFISGGLVLGLFHQDIIYLWTGKVLHQPLLILLMAIWTLLYGLINCCSYLLSGLNIVKNQALFFLIGILLNLTIPLGKYMGEAGDHARIDPRPRSSCHL